MKCKFCQSDFVVKNGFVRKKQRYLCKHCGKNNVAGDERLVHLPAVQFQAVMMALNSVGHRAIGRILGIPYQYS
jgi:transposase-like protein